MAIYNKIYGFIKKICTWINMVGIVIIFIIMFMLVADIVMRNFLNSFILGTYEITEMAMIAIIFCGLAYTQVNKGHVRVEMFVGFLPKKAQYVLDTVIMLASTALCGTIAWSAFGRVKQDIAKNVATSVLKLPYYPFSFLMTVGLTIFTVLLLFETISEILTLFKQSAATEPK